jgi:hypothetical protein
MTGGLRQSVHLGAKSLRFTARDYFVLPRLFKLSDIEHIMEHSFLCTIVYVQVLCQYTLCRVHHSIKWFHSLACNTFFYNTWYGMVYSGAGFPMHCDLYVVYCKSPVNFQLSRHTLSAPALCTAYLPKNSGIQR